MAFCSTEHDDEYGYDGRRFQKDVDENFHCSICYNVLKEPRMCQNNEHMFCLACITRNLNENSESCPECNEHLTVNTLRPAPRVVNNYLSELKIKCDFASRGCPEFIRLEALKTHVASCGFAPVLCSNENCGLEINKGERLHHETEVCEYRKVKCHDCEKIQELVGVTNEKVETLKGNVQAVNNKVQCVENNLLNVTKDLAELKVIMTQMLDKVNKLEEVKYMPHKAESKQKVLASYEDLIPVNKSGITYRPPAFSQAASFGIQRVQTRTPALIGGVLDPSALVQASPSDQKQMLGECLYPLIQQIHPDLAGKITGMLLEISNTELLHILEFREALTGKVLEAVNVLHKHKARTKGVRGPQH